MKHFELTKKVIELMSSKNEMLMKQFESAKVLEEVDEVGYYANFTIQNKDGFTPISKMIPNIIGKNKDGKTVVGFVLFLKDGFIDCLEGYTFGDELWPQSDEEIILEQV